MNESMFQANKASTNIALYGGGKLTYGPFNKVFPSPPRKLSQNVAYKNISILAGTTKHDGSFVLTCKMLSIFKNYKFNI